MQVFSSSQRVGEIVAIMPKASEIFKEYKIDFCCGGNRPLIEAIKEQNLNESEVLKKLDTAFEENKQIMSSDKSFTEMTLGGLMEHIESTHHVYMKSILPELGELTTKIMRVHGVNHDVLFKLHKLFAALRAELEQHLMKEEETLFPLIREYDRTPNSVNLERIHNVVRETEDEHEEAGKVLKELRKITGDYKVPEDACSTYHLAFKKLEEMESDLFQHIHLENNILFKRLGIINVKM